MRIFWLALALYSSLTLVTSTAKCDETHARYYDQLRQRGLFSLAESDAISRLSADDLPLAERTNCTIELSRTLTEHAGFVSDEQRTELWLRARRTVQELLERDRSNPRSILLGGQLAAVYVAEGDWLRAEHELRPFDQSLIKQARESCTSAIDQLKSIEKTLGDPVRDASQKKTVMGAPSGYEVRNVIHQVRWQLGQSYRNQAELSPPGSDERSKSLAEAEQALRRLVGAADEPLQSRARLLLVVCLRLKGERERALESLANLEKIEPKPSDMLDEEITAEHARLMLETNRPTEAAELLLKTRGRRQRLSGELWLLQTRALIALRAVTLAKQQSTLADRLTEQIGTTIDRCEEQVGGFWSRRCRQAWENAQTSQKYGEQLDTLMQQARADFVSGRIDAALAEYAIAETVANEKGQPELAMELGLTRASILLDEMQYEVANTEFFRLANLYAGQARAPRSHLLGTYCLGRLYDDKRTQLRREAYAEALNRHLKEYPHDPTINDVRFLKAQFEEQRLQATLALPLYLQVESQHTRALDAMAGAARCYEVILRRMIERRMPMDEFEREAVDRLTEFLSASANSNDLWNDTYSDVALRLAAILLMGSEAESTPKGAGPSLKNQTQPVPGVRDSDRCRQAERWLARVSAFIERPDAGASETVERTRQRIAPLQIVALAGSGRSIEAQKIFDALSASPTDTLKVLERLTQFVATSTGGQRVQIATLQLQAAERLIPLRDQLTVDECRRLDWCVVNAYVSSGQLANAVKIARKMAEQSAKDLNTQRDLAILFGGVVQSDGQSVAKQCWRRVESLTKAGSTEWLTARMGVLSACVGLKQFEEGQKLLQVTKLLYSDLGRDPFKSQIEFLEKAIEVGIASSQ